MSGVWHLVLVYSDVGAVVGCVHSLLRSDISSINASFPRLSVIICYGFFFFYLLEFFSLFYFFSSFYLFIIIFCNRCQKIYNDYFKKNLGTVKKMLRQQVQLKFKRTLKRKLCS